MSNNISRQRRLSRLLSGEEGMNITNFDWDPDVDGDNQLDWPDGKPDISIFNNDANYLSGSSLEAGPGIYITTPTEDQPNYQIETDVLELTNNSGMTLGTHRLDRSGTLTRIKSLHINPDVSSVVHTIGNTVHNKIQSKDDEVSFFFAHGHGAREQFRFDKLGNLHANADVIAYSSTIPSDPRLKTDLKPIDSALERVGKLNGYTYHYINGKASAGVLSSEVREVLPSAVTKRELPLMLQDGTQYETVDYAQLHGLMIEAIKELTARVKELEDGIQ